MIDLYHEKVQEGHKVWFITTVLNSLFIPPHRLIDLSLKWKLINKFSEKLARLIKEKLKEELLPNGHTVVCIYKKDQPHEELNVAKIEELNIMKIKPD